MYVPYCNCYHRLQLVFQWFVTAFAGQLECQELLLLWDRIVGFDSLDILAGRPPCLSLSHYKMCKLLLW